MKRNVLILTALSLILAIGTAFSQAKLDLTGTWEGPTYAEGPGFELTFTLVLEHKNNTINGKLHDDQGYIDCDITEVKLTGDALTFEAIAGTPDGSLPMTFIMTCSNDELKGKWEAGMEAYGDWTAGRKQ